MTLDYLDKIQIEQIINEYIPNSIDETIHVNPNIVMRDHIHDILEKDILPFNKKNVTFICKQWQNILYKKYSILN
jgi:hypothetical protein